MRRYTLHIIIALLSAFAGTAQAQIVDTVCALGGPSNLAVNANAGSTYQWNINGATILSGQGTNDVLVDWPNASAVVDAWVVETSSDGCVGDTVNAQVLVVEPSSSYITGPTQVCEGEYVQLRAYDTKQDGKFEWNNGDSADVISFFARQDTMIYRIAYNQNCEHDTVYHFVDVMPTPVVMVSTSAISDTVSFNSTVNFTYDGNSVGQIEWYLNDLWMASGANANIVFSQPGWNQLKVIATSGQCSDTLYHNMFVEENLKVHLASAFSPNGDGVNDEWTLVGLGFDEYEVIILDRWGEVLTQWDHNTPSSWDGTRNGRTVAPGVYHYKVRVTTINNHYKYYTGSITVIL